MASVSSLFLVVLLFLVVVVDVDMAKVDSEENFQANYADALSKSILFFEGQRSGLIPASQRMKWRKKSAMSDARDVGLDLTGGYYDAGDNVKYNFPMAFTTSMLAWSVIEFRDSMGQELGSALQAIKWATDYFLKCTSSPYKVYVQVGEPTKDHNCWERPEDMDTDRTAYAVDKNHPGSEVSAEMAASLAASSIAFKSSNPTYSVLLMRRAIAVFDFADKYRGNYNEPLRPVVCPFYCDWSGCQDELVWAASWLYKATNNPVYGDYVMKNLERKNPKNSEFGWDDKHAGIFVMNSNDLRTNSTPENGIFRSNSDQFVCTILPESPTLGVQYSPGGLLHKKGGSNMQRVTAISFLLITYSRYLAHANQVVHCGNKVATPERIISLAKDQVDYILGKNPMQMSYMVGYGHKFPQRIHHRASSLPSIDQYPKKLGCQDGKPYYESEKPNPNLLIGAVVGGPSCPDNAPPNDTYVDSRSLFVESEPTTYINAPLVGVLAYFSSRTRN